jgi:uncharacterized membrane protein YfcA
MYFKQLNDDPARFGDELLKRMKQLVAIYVVVALVAAFASNHIPNKTKTTIGSVFTVILLYMAFRFKSSPK